MNDTNILDRIDVRYAVDAHFEFGDRDFFIVKASFQITCGLYAGNPTPDIIAGLIAERGVHAGDIDDVSGADHSKEIAAAMIRERGIEARDIRNMKIVTVIVDDAEVAQSI